MNSAGPTSPRPTPAPLLDLFDGEPPLRIARGVFEAMIAHCHGALPCEACGVLAGTEPPHAVAHYPLRNRLASPTRYDADPADLLAMHKSMRARGELFLAIYHSHPTSPPEPSRVDLAENYYGPLPRLIVSFASDEPEVRVWRLHAESSEELRWSVVDE